MQTTHLQSIEDIASFQNVTPQAIRKQLTRKAKSGELKISTQEIQDISNNTVLPNHILDAVLILRKINKPTPHAVGDSVVIPYKEENRDFKNNYTSPKPKQTVKAISPFKKVNWWKIFSRSPLPMFGLVTSHGVYQFTNAFTGNFIISLLCCAALEITYITIAFTPQTQPKKKRLSNLVAGLAVATSLIYTVTAGWMHHQIEWLECLEHSKLFFMCVLHGAPPALLSFSIALLNSEK